MLEAPEPCCDAAALLLAQQRQLQKELAKPFPDESFQYSAQRIFTAIYGTAISAQTLADILASSSVHDHYKLLATRYLSPQLDLREFVQMDSAQLLRFLHWGPTAAAESAACTLHQRGHLQPLLAQPEILSHPYSSTIIFEEIYGSSISLHTLANILNSPAIHADYKVIAAQHTPVSELSGFRVEALEMLLRHYPAPAAIQALYLKKSEAAAQVLLQLVIDCQPNQSLAAEAAACLRLLYREEPTLQPLLTPYMHKRYHAGEQAQIYSSADTYFEAEEVPEVYL